MTLKEMLIADEDKRLFVYDDATGKPIKAGSRVVGNPTIGIGRNLAGKGITQEEMFFLFANDEREVKEQLAKALPWYLSLSPVRQLVMQNLCFNMGLDGLLECEPTLTLIRAGNYTQAADHMTKWLWYRQVKGRAKRLVAMMRDDREESAT